MSVTLTSSQLTFVDITDQRKLSVYLTSNLATIQIYDSDAGTYTPNWGTTNLTITPNVFLDQTAVDLSDSNLTISWKRKDGSNAETEIASSESVSSSALTVSANNLGSAVANMITYVCYASYYDVETQNTVTVSSQLTYTLVKTAPKAKYCSITGPQVFKYDKDGKLTSTNPISINGSVSTNINISAWQYYNNSESTWSKYPNSSTSSVLSVSASDDVFDSSGTARIKLVTTDADVYDIITVTKIYDGATGAQGNTGSSGYTVLLTNESYTFPGGTTYATQGSTATTQVMAYKGATAQAVTVNTIGGITPSSTASDMSVYSGMQVKIDNTTKMNGVVSPTITFSISSASFATASGTIDIVMTVDGTSFTKKFSWAVAKTGSGACSVSIAASSQVFKSSDGTNFTPSAVTLTPIVQNLTLSNCKWYISTDGGSSFSTDPITATSGDLYVKSDYSLYISNACAEFTSTVTSLVFKCTNTNNYYDIVTISKLSDGQSAAAAYTVILSNEAQVIATDTSLKPLSSQTYSCAITVYKGTDQLTPVASTATPTTGQFNVTTKTVTGFTIKQSTAGTVTFAVTAGTAIAASGSIALSINVEGDSTITKSIAYAASKQGSSGASAVAFTVYAPNGTVFYNNDTLELDALGYDGSTQITSGATYQWAKFTSSGWTNISGATSSTYTAQSTDVANIMSYKCTMTYNSKTYVDVITLEDKTDIYVSEMMTIGGTTFKNGLGGSAVYVILRKNGNEEDALIGNISANYPTNPTSGTYLYYIDSTNKQIVLQKFDGSSWVTATDKTQSLTYTWSLMDKDGNQQAFSDTKYTKTGKVIYLSSSDINSVGTLQCDVTNGSST